MPTNPERIAAAAKRRYGTALEIPRGVPNLEALAALNERSVCRRYRPDPVPEEMVRLLCATALAAPTKSDLQQATLVRLADPAKRAAVCALLPGSPWLAVGWLLPALALVTSSLALASRVDPLVSSLALAAAWLVVALPALHPDVDPLLVATLGVQATCLALTVFAGLALVRQARTPVVLGSPA